MWCGIFLRARKENERVWEREQLAIIVYSYIWINEFRGDNLKKYGRINSYVWKNVNFFNHNFYFLHNVIKEDKRRKNVCSLKRHICSLREKKYLLYKERENFKISRKKQRPQKFCFWNALVILRTEQSAFQAKL